MKKVNDAVSYLYSAIEVFIWYSCVCMCVSMGRECDPSQYISLYCIFFMCTSLIINKRSIHVRNRRRPRHFSCLLWIATTIRCNCSIISLYFIQRYFICLVQWYKKKNTTCVTCIHDERGFIIISILVEIKFRIVEKF